MNSHDYCYTSSFVLQGRSIDGVPASHTSVLQDMLDLRPYIDSSAAAVQESFSLERTYVVFRTLGLRHLVVVDRHNHVKGMVTRKASDVPCCILVALLESARKCRGRIL